MPRAEVDVDAVVERVRPILDAVRERGTEAVLEYSEQFDRVRPVAVRVPAAALADALGVELRLDARLREIGAGRWQGLLQPEIEALDPVAFAAWRTGDDVVLGGDERPSEAGERVRAAVTEHAAACDEGQVLVVVGHGASIRSGLSILLGQPELRRVLVPLGNTGTALLSAGTTSGQAWRLHGWNVPPGALGDVLGRRSSASAAVT